MIQKVNTQSRKDTGTLDISHLSNRRSTTQKSPLKSPGKERGQQEIAGKLEELDKKCQVQDQVIQGMETEYQKLLGEKTQMHHNFEALRRMNE